MAGHDLNHLLQLERIAKELNVCGAGARARGF